VRAIVPPPPSARAATATRASPPPPPAARSFGFGLKAAAPLFSALPEFLFLIWVLLALGWAGPAALARVARAAASARAARRRAPLERGQRTLPFVPMAPPASPAPSGPGGALTPDAPPTVGGLPLSDKNLADLAHLLGVAFTAMAFVQGSVAFVQVFKSLAPLFTAAYAAAYLGATFPPAALGAVAGLAAGAAACAYREPAFSAAALAACAVTNLALPLRNVLTKRMAAAAAAAAPPGGGGGAARAPGGKPPGFRGPARPPRDAADAAFAGVAASLDATARLNAGALFFLSAGCLAVPAAILPRAALTRRAAAAAVRLGALRAVYEAASLLVLARVDPVVHASLDVSKRAGITVASLVVAASASGGAPPPLALAGALAFFGCLLWYKVLLRRHAQAVADGDEGARRGALRLEPALGAAVGRALQFAMVGAASLGFLLFLIE
jgi:hypothetical protein